MSKTIELKKKSKMNFTTDTNDIDQLNTGCFQRIAESLEKSERPFLEQLTHNPLILNS